MSNLALDRLNPLFNNFALTARVFFTGASCLAAVFDGKGSVGHLHLLRSGCISVKNRGVDSFYVDQPSVLFYPRSCPHALLPDEGTEINLVCATIEFGDRVGSPLSLALPEMVILPLDSIKTLAPSLELLFSEAFTDQLGRQVALDRLAVYFVIQLIRHIISSGMMQTGMLAALADTRLAKTVYAMHARSEHAWSVEELAEEAGMSRARFAVHFRDTVGCTPLDYLTGLRICLAQTLMKQGKPIKTVASLVGYRSPAALSRVFSKRVGISPSEWLGSENPV
ncbi:MAG: AraC family transcriptional regulator [Propionivibrio sp.]|uniref:AraC family transcriptional regulator n=1 Tax=Propionivibrio sp. TaxID=2212460 RepID=UPI001A3AA4AC|nr:AraC family transcriptional regulator [Propionivibrio sp.]MBL8415850.1 AraC family transcriptional regulator [Propionivibrio sp.]